MTDITTIIASVIVAILSIIIMYNVGRNKKIDAIVDNKKTTKSGIDTKIVFLCGIVMTLIIILAIVMILKSGILPTNITPEHTETPVTEETFTPLPTETPEPTDTPVINNKNNISNGTNGTNNNKSGINVINKSKDKNDTANGSVPIITPIRVPTNILPNMTQNALIPT